MTQINSKTICEDSSKYGVLLNDPREECPPPRTDEDRFDCKTLDQVRRTSEDHGTSASPIAIQARTNLHDAFVEGGSFVPSFFFDCPVGLCAPPVSSASMIFESDPFTLSRK